MCPPTCCNPCASLTAGPLLHRCSPSSTRLAHCTAAFALPSMSCPHFPCSSLQQSDFWACWELFLRCFIQTLEQFLEQIFPRSMWGISPPYRAGAALLWRAERAGDIEPGEEKAPRSPGSLFQCLKELQDSWRGALDKDLD